MTKKADLFRVLCRRWLTPLESASVCGLLSLSQRVGELRRAGHIVADKWVKLPSGSRCKAYKIVRTSKPVA